MLFYIAQVLSFIGASLIFYSTFCETKEKMLQLQIADASVNCIASILLGAWTGVILNIVAVVRNYLSINKKINNVCLFIILMSAFVVSLFGNDLIGILPLIASIEYTVAIAKGTHYQTKIALAINLFLWFCYDVIKQAYPMAVCDLIILISTIATLVKTSEERNGNRYAFSVSLQSSNDTTNENNSVITGSDTDNDNIVDEIMNSIQNNEFMDGDTNYE